MVRTCRKTEMVKKRNKVSIPSSRGNGSDSNGSVGDSYYSKSLNPLKSGQWFGRVNSLKTKRGFNVSIPSSRGNGSDKLNNIRYMSSLTLSQSPQVGAMVRTDISDPRFDAVY